MITVQRDFTFAAGTAPYTYTWVVTGGCATVTPVSGTTSGAITSLFEFEDQACFNSSTFSLNVTDANGCTSTFSISVQNPCTNFSTTPIVQSNGYKFEIQAASPQCSATNSTWTYDNTLFTGVVFSTDFTSILTLFPNTAISAWPNASQVSVVSSDCNGCETTTTLNFNICKPVPQPITASLSCIGSTFTSPIFEVPLPTGCPNATIDWSTIQFLSNPEFTITNVPALGNRAFVITSPLSTTPGLYSAVYTIRTTQGIQTQQGQISIIVNSCGDDPIVIPDYTTQVECTNVIGDFIYIDIEDRVLTSLDIDWNSFALITPPTPLSTDITLVTQIDGRHYIRYEIPAITGSDTFRWTVCTTGGFCANAATYTVILECPVEPTAVDDDVCAECGESIVVDVLDNDLSGGSPFLLSSIAVTAQPTLGSVTIPGDGTIIYTAFPFSSGTDYFSYTVTNAGGSVSNEGLVTVEVICAGGDGTATVCNA